MGGITQVRRTATAIPIRPPAKVSTRASSRNCTRTWRGRAPRAFRSPISRVRSVTDTSMMFITPTPPTPSVTAPISPSTACNPSEKALIMARSSMVSHSGVAFFILGIEVMAAGHNLANRSQRLLVQLRSCGLENDHVRVANIFQIAKNLERNKTVAVVGPHVHRILNLIAQHADDFEIQAADAYVLSNRRRALKYFLVRIVPQDHYPAMLHKIVLIEVAAIVDVEPAHLTIGHFHASYLHRNHPCAHFESEVTI